MLQEGKSPAAALRAAQIKMMSDKRWQHPYFWAGFVVYGSPGFAGADRRGSTSITPGL